jgi:flagellar basal-body rod modification protein FlgD
MISAIDTNSTTQTVSSRDTATADVMGKDDFLNLLVTQLKYQDPLNPVDSAEFTAQLAQFSSLEQLYNVNDNLGGLDGLQKGINNLQATSYIGKKLFSYGNNLELADKNEVAGYFEIGADADTVTVNISDNAGNLVRTIEKGSATQGQQSFSWDGLDNEGAESDPGIYSFEIVAYDQNGELVDTVCYTKDTITGITYNDGVPYLNASQRSIPLSSVFRISDDQS